MKVSKMDMKHKIEYILSEILSDKYEAKIIIKFMKTEESNENDNIDKTGSIGK